MSANVSPTPDALQTPLQFIKGVGPRRADAFAAVGLRCLEDLLLRLPIRYENRSQFQPIGGLRPGETVSVAGQVLGSAVRPTRRHGLQVFELVLGDASGQIRAVFFNQGYLKEVLTVHQHTILFGRVEPRRSGGLQLTNPQYEVIDDDASHDSASNGQLVHTGRIVPVYERIGPITPKLLRRIVHGAVQRLPDEVEDPLPAPLRLEFGLPSRRRALAEAHFPAPGASVDTLNRFCEASQRRLIFEEFFAFQLGLALRRRATATRQKPRRVHVDDRIRRAALEVLPFRLTSGQREALKEIVDDLQRPQPMNRLLQGDVGSGKTIVALLAALVTMENGFQVAVMSPTELLAEQHFETLSSLLAKTRFQVVCLTGTMGMRSRRAAWKALAGGESQLVVGTHALVQEAVSFRTLGLVVIDEQHRFGVLQRATLREKGLEPDVLVMTATPIPRTLALTAYGDLDTSVIRDLPPGRRPVRTVVRPETTRAEAYRLVTQELDRGRQAYVVYPLVEESAKVDLSAAIEMAEHLETTVFPSRRLAVLHGRMKGAERERIMREFVAHEIDILVATTVVEVGVDVPNASVMLVEHAERFGLAQLHQLRGRVGRGHHQSHCLLLYRHPLSDTGRARLDAMAETTDGFLLAERDLELRGPGDFFGTRQSGIPILRVGNLLRDHRLMEAARRAAQTWLTSGRADADTLATLGRGWAERFGLVGVG